MCTYVTNVVNINLEYLIKRILNICFLPVDNQDQIIPQYYG
jgi:hypothetical protein